MLDTINTLDNASLAHDQIVKGFSRMIFVMRVKLGIRVAACCDQRVGAESLWCWSVKMEPVRGTDWAKPAEDRKRRLHVFFLRVYPTLSSRFVPRNRLYTPQVGNVKGFTK